MDEPDLRQIRVVNGNNEVQIKNAVSELVISLHVKKSIYLASFISNRWIVVAIKYDDLSF